MPIFLTGLFTGGLQKLATLFFGANLAWLAMITAQSMFFAIAKIIGFGFLTYTGVSIGLGVLANQIYSHLADIGAKSQLAFALISHFEVDNFISIIISAYTTTFVIRGIGNNLKIAAFRNTYNS